MYRLASAKVLLKLRKTMQYSDNFSSRCEVCSKQLEDFSEHVESRQHKDNICIVNSFIRHCDLREINPVTCSIKEIIFYFDYIFPKTRHNKQFLVKASIHQTLTSLSRLHDLVDGTELSGNSDIEDHISDLLGAWRIDY